MRLGEDSLRVFVFGIRGFPYVGGGAEKHSEELYPRLVKDYDITILCRQLMFPEYKGIKFIKIPHIKGQAFEVMSHSILCSLYCLWKRPDTVHIHNMGACLLVPLLSMAGIRVIVTLHSLNYEHHKWGWLAKLVLNTCEMIGLNFATQNIVVSKDIYTKMRKKYSGQTKLKIISNGVSEPLKVSPGFMLRRYKLKQRKYILAVGRLVPEKGFDLLIQAYNNINKPDYKLVIVGNDMYNSGYSKHIISSSLYNDNIIFTGFQCGKDLAELYTYAGLFISPSSNEGFPIVVLEAMSYGLPIVLSDIPAHKEVNLADDKYFESCNINHMQELIEKNIKEGITDKEKDYYRKLLKEKYDWNAITKEVAFLYEYK